MGLTKRIISPTDLRQWASSIAYNEILNLINSVNNKLISQPIHNNLVYSKAISLVCEVLDKLQQAVSDYPPEEQPQRFGNKSFRRWFTWLQENAISLCSIIFHDHGTTDFSDPPISYTEALEEVAGYLTESVGNSIRIDYGTGHELAFLAFLTCLFKIKILQTQKTDPDSSTANDLLAVGLIIMPKYLTLVRLLQTTYRMEPAGSHGVWCLDDFQFVPFIWGSSQLIGCQKYDPTVISDREVAEREKDNYLLFSCIAYIYQCKTGPFEEHSHTLFGISQVPKWEKVNCGLIKMYKAEVLDKFPVVQHFLFGSLLSFDRVQHELPDNNRSFNQRECIPSNIHSIRKPVMSTNDSQQKSSQHDEHS
uniref:Serine/threonine-protein phosphatase 2A activator n=2 Tax=Schistosoma japonicum TaxID=6182 RepID=C1L746_SCHJA|nr:Serine/threonine-protein phosphatase 2A regulatory subunit B' [Schistosoma japonicum]